MLKPNISLLFNLGLIRLGTISLGYIEENIIFWLKMPILQR